MYGGFKSIESQDYLSSRSVFPGLVLLFAECSENPCHLCLAEKNYILSSCLLDASHRSCAGHC